MQRNVINETEVDLFGGEKANSSAAVKCAEFKIIPGISDIAKRKVIRKILEEHASFLKNVATLGFFQINQVRYFLIYREQLFGIREKMLIA